MIRTFDDFNVSHVPNLKGGNKITKIVNLFNEEDFSGMGRLFGITVLEPGGSIGVHEHVGEQEAYFILEGTAVYNDNGVESVLYPGHLALCRDGEFHAIENNSDQELKYIALISNTK